MPLLTFPLGVPRAGGVRGRECQAGARGAHSRGPQARPVSPEPTGALRTRLPRGSSHRC